MSSSHLNTPIGVSLPPPPRVRGHGDNDAGNESDSSLPSLQTASDSSGDEFLSGEDEDEDEETDEDEVSDEDEQDENYNWYENEVPRFVPSSTQDRPPPPRPQPQTQPRVARPPPPPQWRLRYSDEEEDEEGEGGRHTPGDFGASLLQAIMGIDRASDTNNSQDLRMLETLLGVFRGPGIMAGGTLQSPQLQPDEDPERAEIIMARLEVVSEDLLGRYEKLRAGSRDDVEGCAICRDSFTTEPSITPPEDKPTVVFLSQLPFHLTRGPEILAFPCPGKHLFHDDCLSPWLSRKTTCPTCRFDVDPDSLTLRVDPPSRSGLSSRYFYQDFRRLWEPPRTKPFKEWLEEEENRTRDSATIPLRQPQTKPQRTLPVTPVPAYRSLSPPRRFIPPAFVTQVESRVADYRAIPPFQRRPPILPGGEQLSFIGHLGSLSRTMRGARSAGRNDSGSISEPPDLEDDDSSGSDEPPPMIPDTITSSLPAHSSTGASSAAGSDDDDSDDLPPLIPDHLTSSPANALS